MNLALQRTVLSVNTDAWSGGCVSVDVVSLSVKHKKERCISRSDLLHIPVKHFYSALNSMYPYAQFCTALLNPFQRTKSLHIASVYAILLNSFFFGIRFIVSSDAVLEAPCSVKIA